jgi:ABC-type maltose transport system permease subunit
LTYFFFNSLSENVQKRLNFFGSKTTEIMENKTVIMTFDASLGALTFLFDQSYSTACNIYIKNDTFFAHSKVKAKWTNEDAFRRWLMNNMKIAFVKVYGRLLYCVPVLLTWITNNVINVWKD